jgi:hypothetical protein
MENNKFIKMKEEYEAMRASEGLRSKIETIIAQKGKASILPMRIMLTAACIMAVFIGSLNLFPQAAYAMSDIPVLNEIVQIVTFGRYETKGKGYEADVVTPQVDGLTDKELEKKINEELKGDASALIEAFQADVKAGENAGVEGGPHMAVEHGYQILTNDDRYFSVDIYTLTIQASGAESHKFYTIDKKTGKLVTLDQYFSSDYDYVTALSSYIKGEMLRRNKEESAVFFVDGGADDDFTSIKPQQNFYVNKKHELVICFDEYEVAAGVQGAPNFVIPEQLIQDHTRLK